MRIGVRSLALAGLFVLAGCGGNGEEAGTNNAEVAADNFDVATENDLNAAAVENLGTQAAELAAGNQSGADAANSSSPKVETVAPPPEDAVTNGI